MFWVWFWKPQMSNNLDVQSHRMSLCPVPATSVDHGEEEDNNVSCSSADLFTHMFRLTTNLQIRAHFCSRELVMRNEHLQDIIIIIMFCRYVYEHPRRRCTLPCPPPSFRQIVSCDRGKEFNLKMHSTISTRSSKYHLISRGSWLIERRGMNTPKCSFFYCCCSMSPCNHIYREDDSAAIKVNHGEPSLFKMMSSSHLVYYNRRIWDALTRRRVIVWERGKALTCTHSPIDLETIM